MKKILKYKKTLFTFLLILVLSIGTFTYFTYFTEQAKAKQVVDKYLKAMKNSEDTFEYSSSDVDDFINLLDYEFQRQTNYKMVGSKDYVDYVSFYEGEYGEYEEDFSFGDYLELQKDKYGAENVVQQETGDYVIIKDKLPEYEFLYRIENTNSLGEKLFSKYSFIVTKENLNSEFKVIETEKNN